MYLRLATRGVSTLVGALERSLPPLCPDSEFPPAFSPEFVLLSRDEGVGDFMAGWDCSCDTSPSRGGRVSLGRCQNQHSHLYLLTRSPHQPFPLSSCYPYGVQAASGMIGTVLVMFPLLARGSALVDVPQRSPQLLCREPVPTFPTELTTFFVDEWIGN